MGALRTALGQARQLGITAEQLEEKTGHAKPAGDVHGQAADAAARRMAQGGGADHRAELESDLQGDPSVDPKLAAAVLRSLEHAIDDELAVIDELLALPGERAHVADFFRGAHTILRDGGTLYEKLRQLPSAVARGTTGHGSSHAAKGEQYNIPTHAGAILFGLEPDGSGTFFQLEGHDLSSLSEILQHGIDFAKYLLTHRNQSKFGSSEHTDKDPIFLNARADPAPSLTARS